MKTNGLIVPDEIIEKAGLGHDVSFVVKNHMIIVKPKSLTDKVKGIVKDSKFSMDIWKKFIFKDHE